MGVKLPGDKLRHVFEFFDADGDMHLDACEFCQARPASNARPRTPSARLGHA